VQHLGEVREHRVKIDDLALHHLLAAEHEQLTRKTRTTFRSRGNLRQRFSHARLAIVLTEQPVGVALDDGEDVIEIMRHARGQLPDRFKLLRVPQLRFEVRALCDIAAVAMHHLAGDDWEKRPR